MPGFLKRLELANKAVWKGFFRLLFARKRRVTGDDLKRVKSVLFLRYDRIGDMIVSTPLFRGVKEQNGDVRVGVLAGELNSRIVSGDPNVDFVHVFSRLRPVKSFVEILRARGKRYDAVVNLNLNDSLTGSLLANFISPRGIKIARESRDHAYFYDLLLPIRRDNNRPMVELLFPFLEVFGPLPPDDLLVPYLVVSEEVWARTRANLARMGIDISDAGNSGDFVVVNISAGREWRRWGSERYAELIREIIKDRAGSLEVIVLADPRDRSHRDELMGNLREMPVKSYPSTADLMEVAALIGMARAVISPDTSIVHFASAMRTPIVGLFTSIGTNPMEWQPYGIPHRSVFAPEGGPVASISPEEVYGEFVDLMEEIGGAQEPLEGKEGPDGS